MFPSENKQPDDFFEKYLSVWVQNHLYCFKLDNVTEIIPIIEISQINYMSENILGLINLRGESIPVYTLFFMTDSKNSVLFEKQKLLILNHNRKKIAILIDNVGDIVAIESEKIFAFNAKEGIKFIQSAIVSNKTALIIDIEEFLNYNTPIRATASDNTTALLCNENVKARTQLMKQTSGGSILKDSFFNEKFIIFTLNNETYAFNISYIKEIKNIEASSIRKIPCVPDFVHGIINFRGDYICLIDIKSFLNIETGPVCTQPNIIVAKINNMKIAILVDSIVDITALAISNMNSDSPSDSFIIGEISHNNMLINMLNVEQLFSAENVNIESYE